jgi:transcriptional regulator with XRE-family HTH domain
MSTLKDWLEREGISKAEFARRLGCSAATMGRAVEGTHIPHVDLMQKIYRLTKGEVQPNDFYGFRTNWRAPRRRREK